ncbi:MAG: rhodanese-related sulfurtransferase [Spirulinaceae cyanobacterium RM2_2_10]|nr:rhodanese-related sulfurtransferase [Spirulinaceae cyanobacterium SM2_1_0]NJO21076.1 rhodanese-related sulfurtransferase [Spirulinaceae cyanobacterium RM2_2_10]
MHPAIAIVTFYRFTALPDWASWQADLQVLGEQQQLKGTILLAAEGINATIAGTAAGVEALLAWLQRDRRFHSLDCKWSYSDRLPFERFKVKVKPEIVTLGQPAVNPAQLAGDRIAPAHWNALIDDPGVTVIDTRNRYEVAIGSFAGAIDPQLGHFREFPGYVAQNLSEQRDRPVAMFCTGGIRCEKASAYLRQQGFREVYQLHGGILHYLATTPPAASRWQGECFVFDQRVSVTPELEPGHYVLSPAGEPIPPTDR